MTKTELKQNITKINKLLRSDSYEAGIELIKTLDDPEISKGTARTVVGRIKKLLKEGDKSRISGVNGYDVSVQIAREFNESVIYEEILKGCSIDTETGEVNISKSKIFKGTRDTRQDLGMTLLSFISFAPKNAKIDKSLKMGNIKILSLSIVATSIGNSFRPHIYNYLPKALAYFTNLQILYLGGGYKNLQDLDVLEKHKNLKKLNLYGCESLQNVDELGNCATLQELDLYRCRSLHNVDGLADLTELTSLRLDHCESLQNVDGLSNCTNLTELSLSECTSLQNVDGISNCTNLTELSLSKCTSLKNVDGLPNCTNLPKLSLSGCASLQNVDGLSNCTNLTELSLSECTSLKNTDSLSNCKNLKGLDLSGCISLKETYGLENGSSLTNLNLCNNYYYQGYGLFGRSNLAGKDYTPIKTLDITPSQSNMTTREQVIEYQEKISLIKALNNKDKKKLSKYKDKKNIDLSSSNGLYNIDGLTMFEELEYLDLSKCPNIIPKPSPVTMTTYKQVRTYQMKLMKKMGIKIPNSLKSSSNSTKKQIKYKSIPPPAKTIRKIKGLLKKRDYDMIKTGIELARSLESPYVFETLLKGCAIDKNGTFIKNKIFSGSTPAKEYLNYAFLNLIGFAPKDTNIDKSLVVQNITSLDLGYGGIESSGWTDLPAGLANFKKMKTLEVSSWSLKDISSISNLSSLTHLDLACSCENLDALSNLKNLKFLDLSNSTSLKNIDAMAKLSNLEELKLPRLLEVKLLPKSIGFLTHLTELSLIQWKELANVDVLANCIKLQSIRFDGYILGGDLAYLPDGLAEIPNLKTIYINLKELQNVDGLKNLLNLTSLELESCDNLHNIDGLENLSNLKNLKLWSCDNLQNVNGLVNLTNLTSLDLRLCKLIRPKPSKEDMTTREEVAAYQEEIKKSMK